MAGEGDVIRQILAVIRALQTVSAVFLEKGQSAPPGEFRRGAAASFAHGKQAAGKGESHFPLHFVRGNGQIFRDPVGNFQEQVHEGTLAGRPILAIRDSSSLIERCVREQASA